MSARRPDAPRIFTRSRALPRRAHRRPPRIRIPRTPRIRTRVPHIRIPRIRIRVPGFTVTPGCNALMMAGDEPPRVDEDSAEDTDEDSAEDAAKDTALDAAKGTAFTSDQLSEAITQLHALEVATHRQLLEHIAAFDEQEKWREDLCPSMAAWLVARLSISSSTAAEWVRVAEALRGLPAIAEVVAEGRLSWDQLVPLTRFAKEATDQTLAEAAPRWSAAETKQLAERARTPKVADANEAHRARRLTWWSDAHLLHLRGALPTEAGAQLTGVLTSLAASAPKDPETDTYEPFEARAADALVELAAMKAGELADPDRPFVVVHTDPAALGGDEEGEAELAEGRRIAAATARRLACDCRWQLVVEHEDGEVVRLGRTTRQVPAWLNRQLRRRDRGCRFTGCGATRWLHAHHLTHWADGGPTDQDNLVMLCGRHHRVVHEGGWQVHAARDGTVTFEKPSGQVLTCGPPPLRPDVRHRLFGPDPPPGPRPPAVPPPPLST